MIQSESEPIQLHVTIIETKGSAAFLIVSHDGQNELGLSADLDPEAAVIIQLDAAQIVKEEAPSLTGGELKCKWWVNGKWSDRNLDLVAVFDKDLRHCEVVLKVTDRHLD